MTRVGENAVPGEFRLKDGLHPTRCQRLEVAHECEQTQLTPFRTPEVGTHRWAARVREHHEEHTTVQITSGGVFFGGREHGSMEITRPGLTNQLDLPAHRVHVDDCISLPDRVRPMGHQEVPGHERQMGLRRGLACFLRRLLGFSPAFIDDRFWDA